MSAEIAVLQSLVKHPFDYKRAFKCIPKNLKMMYIHAVQSWMWNKAASWRIKRMGREIQIADFVWNERGRLDFVTMEHTMLRTYGIEDVLIPVPGAKSELPPHYLGDYMRKLLKETGLTLKMFGEIEDREIRANGDYRNLVVRPKDFEYTIKEYHHPLQPLLQTDLMKLHGEDITIEPPAPAPPAPEEGKATNNGDDADKGDRKEPSSSAASSSSPPPNSGKPLVAMVVGFSLPSSSYATIALRELMRSPTSNEFQTRLKLS